MARPKNKDGIRVKSRSRDGVQTVHFEENPGKWIVSPERDRDKAIAWAKRNRERLIIRNNSTLAFYCKNFYDKNGDWNNRQQDKGRHHGDLQLKNRQAYLDNYFAKEFGHLKPQDIDRPSFRREFDNWLLKLESIRKKTRLSRAARNKIIYSVNDLIEDLVDLRKISSNPLLGLKRYSKNPENPRGTIDRHSLSLMFPAHHKDLIRVWGSPLWACLMLLFNDTGARPGEARALTWKDIDDEKRFIAFRKGIEAGTTDKIKGTKTGVVKAGFLHTRTIQELDIWRSVSKFNNDDDFVFTLNGKKPVTTEGVIKAFRLGLARVKRDNPEWEPKPEWTPYWLRHSFGTYQMETLTDGEIASLMGHGVAILKKDYQHPDDETLYRSAEQIKEKLDRARDIN